ncbi:MAG TPA: hypothetical protein VK473_14370 [Terriglobales bacterium]|nr:hypothetical protein [Terriglobales bacterium]
MGEKRVLQILCEVIEMLVDQQAQINESSALQSAMLLVLNKKVPGYDQELQRVHSGAEELLNATDEPVLRKLKALAQELRKEI